MSGAPLILHDYWRSGASYRTRIALNLKGVDYTQISHDLRSGGQSAADYLDLNPQGLVPALQAGELVIGQSMAIMEWLEERYPEPALLPGDPDGRAIVRAMAMTIGCDVHPLNNLRVLRYLRGSLGAAEDQVQGWIATWIGAGFAALEAMVAKHGGRFAHGEAPTIADCYLVAQYYGAQRFGVPTGDYPRLERAVATALQLDAVARAHPDLQPDAPKGS